MKTYRRPSSGIALVIVLGFLVIISALAVAFFSSVTTELKASRNFASGITTRQLSESAVNVVMGQIRNATSVQNSAWASQPGLIRTFGAGTTASPDALGFYKLYSSSNMVVSATQLSGGYNEATNNPYKDVDSNWSASPALWTDLNSPVAVADPVTPTRTVQRFPIIDPRAYAQQVGDQFTNSDANVEGFWYDTQSAVNGIVGPVGGSEQQRLPMPVRWIYVLQDGSLTAPNGGANTTATWSSSLAIFPKKDNPIVGRIAFWTDDDTSKVNLNTAGGFVDPTQDANLRGAGYDIHSYAGSFWDTPRFFSEFDRGMPYAESLQYPKAGTPVPGKGGLAICQLLQGEYQRYPGHPATTSLGIVFGHLLTSEQMYSILPRLGVTNSRGITPGSSVGGTNRVIIGNTGSDANPTPDNLQLQPKSDRLYASVDELLFAATSKGKLVTSASYVRTTNDTVLKNSFGVAEALTPDTVEKLRFFLTAHSRAPELNLFGRPRISIWPIRFEANTENSGLNPFDNVILFCSTVGASPATANNRPNTMTAPSASQTSLQIARINPAPTLAQLPYRYIFTRRELPATIAPTIANQSPKLPTPSTTWSAPTNWLPDIDQPRNKQLMVYLQSLTSARIPGFSQNSSDTFANKWGDNNRDALLVEIFDYIRNANAKDTTTATIGQTTAIAFAPRGLIMPSKASYLQNAQKFSGMGRFPVISEATIVFYYSGPTFNQAAVAGGTATDPVMPPSFPPGTTSDVEFDRKDPAMPNLTDPAYPGAAAANVALKDRRKATPKYRTMRAFLLFSTFNPMQGYAPIADPAQADPKMELVVSGMQAFTITPVDLDQAAGAIQPIPMGFPASGTLTINKSSGGTWGGRNFGGYEGFMHTLAGTTSNTATWPKNKIMASAATALPLPYNVYASGTGPAPAGTNRFGSDAFTAGILQQFADVNQEYYPLQMDPFLQRPNPAGKWHESMPAAPAAMDNMPGLMRGIPLKWSVKNFSFSGGNLTVLVKYGQQELQKLNINVPGGNLWPVPEGQPPSYPGDIWTNKNNDAAWSAWETNLRDISKWQTEPSFYTEMSKSYWADSGSFYPRWKIAPTEKPTTTVWTFQSRLDASWSFASRLSWSQQNSYAQLLDANKNPLNHYSNRWKQILQPGDTIRSLIYVEDLASKSGMQTTTSGDLRMASQIGSDTSSTTGAPYPLFRHPDWNNNQYNRACLLRVADGTMYFPPPTTNPAFAGSPSPTGLTMITSRFGNHIALSGGNLFPTNRAFGNLPYSGLNGAGINGLVRSDQQPGDFDTGVGSFPDGPFANKQDEGNVIYAYKDANTGLYVYPVPYFGTWAYEEPGNTFTSPNRQMPSAVMFGSLPARPADMSADPNFPGPLHQWETLSFSPVPAGPNHPGNAGLKDHLLLDLFQMPVVEPYPISEPFSTAGKINMNYQILPFTYITRSTGMRAALHALRVTAVRRTEFDKYKTGISSANATSTAAAYDKEKGQNNPVTDEYRFPVDRNETLKAFDAFFDDGRTNASKGIFKSATEICERYFYPLGSDTKYTVGESDIQNWWYDSFTGKALGGDNTREKPYADIYPRLTTKSNTYTVHMRVQTLQQVPKISGSDADYAIWTEGKDRVLGEYRGSTTIERYIDPADPRFDPTNTNFAKPDDITAPNLESIYRFRAVENKKFAP